MADNAQNQEMNTFQDGMRMDVDKLNQPNSSFRYGLNGRLVFNRDGTYAWESERGNIRSFEINPDSGSGLAGIQYTPLGWTGQSNLIVLLSKSKTSNNCEVGIFITGQNGNGTYKTLFNDFNDPYGDLFNFNFENQIEARFIYETDNLLRVYWVDGVKNNSNQPRVFTFKYDNTLPIDDVNSYSAVSISVHSINIQSEFDMGIIKYNETISGGGNVLSGEYQYSYRLATEVGYQTPWIPLSSPVIVSTDAVNNANCWDYEMEGSGVDSGKAVEIIVKGIDQRYDQIEVCYVYIESNALPTQASIFEIVKIASDEMTFIHRSMDGEPILIEELPAYFQGIKKAKTLNIKDESLYIGNTIETTFELNDLEPVLENITIEPYFKNTRSDEYSIQNFIDGKDSNSNSTPPIHRQSVVGGGTCVRSLHSAVGGDETYNVINEYSNYKGTQISFLNKGYFRGETYRIGIVFFDKLGYQSFVHHVADIKFPQQSDNTYTASRLKADGTIQVITPVAMPERAWVTCSFGDYFDDPAIVGLNGSDPTISYLRIMGLKIGGIDITTIKDQISGFMFVRARCDNEILMQGLAMPCVKSTDISRPAPFGHDEWWDCNAGTHPTGASDIGDVELLYGDMMPAETPQSTANCGPTDYYLLRPNLTVFYAPDVDFGYAQVPILQTADRIRLVSTCFQETHSCVGNENCGSGCQAKVNQFFTWGEEYAAPNNADRGREAVRKLYRTKNLDQGFSSGPFNDPYPVHNSETDMLQIINMGINDTKNNYVPTLDLENNGSFDNGCHMGYQDSGIGGKEHLSQGKENSMFLQTGNFNPADPVPGTMPCVSPFFQNPQVSTGIDTYMGSWIMNYVRPNNAPYGGISESSMERTIFFAVGHFQPVNNPTFDAQGMPLNDIFDEVEVWGGDCILDYFGFLRLYPVYDGTNWSTDPFEYSIGEIFPLESRVHHPLRNAPSQENPIYPDVGARPFKEYEDSDTNWPDGIFRVDAEDQLREEFDINSVLFFEESIMLYAPKPLRFIPSAHYPIRWRYTPSKFYGDPIDTWRIFQVNDFDDLNGEYGEITSSLYLFNQIYSFQESAFGRLRASDRALIESSNQGSLTTGIGEKLDGIDYINTEFGNQHQWSLFSSTKAAYWIDVDQRKICRFAQDGFVPLSDIRGLHQWSENELQFYENSDTPVNGLGITGIYDYQNNAAFWSFVRNRELLIKDPLYIVSSFSKSLGNDYVVLNNKDAIYLNDAGVAAVNEVIVPKNASEDGTNELFIFYIIFNGLGQLDIKQKNLNVAPVIIQTVNGTSIWKIYRNHINDDWSVEELLLGIPDHKKYNSLSFNELTNSFVGFHVANPNFYINAKNFTISFLDAIDQTFWVHNYGLVGSFYGNVSSSIVEPIFSPNAMYPKAFDTFKGNVNNNVQNTLANVDMITETTFIDMNMTTDTRIAYKEDVLRFPLRTENQLYRTRGKSLSLILTINNNNYEISRISSITTGYRVSNRI